jgi:hypothetical protein
MYVMMFLCFLLMRSEGLCSLLMGNRLYALVLGACSIDLKLTSGKTLRLNVQHVPTIKKNLVNGSLLCRNGFNPINDTF